MLKYAIFLFGILSAAHSKESRAPATRIEDSLFSALDRGLTHTLAYHYLWPFSQFVRAALDNDEGVDLLQIHSDNQTYEISLMVKRFKPDELKIKVKNQYIIVEGKHKETIADRPIMTNHFVQRYVLPPGCKPEEVKAVLFENGVLSISAPKHKLPPPPPERVVPIEVRLPIEKTEKPIENSSEELTTQEKVEKTDKPIENSSEEITTTEKVYIENRNDFLEKLSKKDNVKKIEAKPTSDLPLWQHLMDTTTHIGKIRKKELKSTTKTIKENEVAKGSEGNGLDYISEADYGY